MPDTHRVKSIDPRKAEAAEAAAAVAGRMPPLLLPWLSFFTPAEDVGCAEDDDKGPRKGGGGEGGGRHGGGEAEPGRPRDLQRCR